MKKRTWIFVVVGIAVLCCCLVVIAGGVTYYLVQTGRLALPGPVPAQTEPPVLIEPTIRPATEVPALGTPGNPIVFAVQPGSDYTIFQSAEKFIEKLGAETGYSMEVRLPETNQELFDGMASGEIHMTLVGPFVYVAAERQGAAEAGMVMVVGGSMFYQAEIIAHADAGFTVYYDEANQRATADARTALAQFEGKRPCWVNYRSPSGYVIPAGYFADAGVGLSEPSFLAAGHAGVVRAIYNQDSDCDFAATFIDGRRLVINEPDYADVLDKVAVIWATDKIISYQILAFSPSVPAPIRAELTDVLSRAGLDPTWADALVNISEEGFAPADSEFDGAYQFFLRYLDASGIPLSDLMDP